MCNHMRFHSININITINYVACKSHFTIYVTVSESKVVKLPGAVKYEQRKFKYQWSFSVAPSHFQVQQMDITFPAI